MKLSTIALLLSSGLLSACANLAPDYPSPQAQVPQEYSVPMGLDEKAAPTEVRALPSPEAFFADEQLQALIAIARQNNRDLRVAVLAIEQARAQYGVQNAASFPSLSANAGGTSARTASNMAAAGQPLVNRQYSVNLGVTAYELDFFGRIRNLKAQAMESYLATEDAARTVRIGLAAEIAHTWFNWSADRNRLALAQELLRSQEETLRLMEQQLDWGETSLLDVRQQQAAVATARLEVAAMLGQEAKDRNALALLLGTPVPEDLAPQTYSGNFEDYATTALTSLPAGLPSDLLLRRPDLLQSEHALKAANANIGVARAAFYPSIRLTASAGTASTELDGLFKGGSRTWSFSPQINLPIFDGGANKANLTIAKTARDIALANYEKTIQTAFREVSDALVERSVVTDQLGSQQELVKASSDALALTRNRFEAGQDDWLDVLNAERTFTNARLALVNLHSLKQNHEVTLYKVLGGGWGQ